MDQLQPQQFSVRVLPRKTSVVRVRVSGALDLCTAPELERVLEPELRSGRRVLLDLSGVWFVDSSGLRAIARAAQIARSQGGELALDSPVPEQARRMIEITGLQALLRPG
jgi:anti-sigma B factor antagonist